jgi:hypothetical protein
MIRKLVSEALLSIVMDKNARKTLEARKTIKKAVKVIEAAKAAEDAPGNAQGDSSGLAGDTAETRKLIADSIAAAEQEFLEKPRLTPERQALINQALSVQRAKANVFEGLTQEQREKLYVVALKSLKPDRDAAIRRRAQRYQGRPRKK